MSSDSNLYRADPSLCRADSSLCFPDSGLIPISVMRIPVFVVLIPVVAGLIPKCLSLFQSLSLSPISVVLIPVPSLCRADSFLFLFCFVWFGLFVVLSCVDLILCRADSGQCGADSGLCGADSSRPLSLHCGSLIPRFSAEAFTDLHCRRRLCFHGWDEVCQRLLWL